MNPNVRGGAETQTVEVALPLDEARARALRAGTPVRLNGVVYTARDAAHRRLAEALDRGEAPPFDLRDAVIYYVGPSPGATDQIVGSAGPTTSSRMDVYTPRLIALGLRGMIGKGERTAPVVEAMRRHGAVYFAATGGAGALLGRCVVASEVVAFADLGAEAVRRLTLRDFPAIVAVDASGRSLYDRTPA
ncbi:MAG: FumA C-terminus/TtdB family hydratase beta subunit [Verrucomicrobia bacterium]|nr:FumA C-terminus/TtdB family hydratase beta subunit [Verrucomicrobiota bacterium]